MIKFIVAALWLCAVTAGTIFFSFSASAPKSDADAKVPAYFGGLDYIKADMISVPHIYDGEVQGYFLARLVYTAEPAKLKTLTIPMQNLLLDSVYEFIYGNFPVDVTKPDSFNLETLKSGIRDNINKRAESELIHEVLVEQVDYIPKSEIRDNALKRRIAPTKFLTTGSKDGEPGDAEAGGAEAGGH
jgi:hypothetical protein